MTTNKKQLSTHLSKNFHATHCQFQVFLAEGFQDGFHPVARILEDMIQQGMSADEIERVLLAAGFNRRRTRHQVLQQINVGAEPKRREG